MPEDGGSEPFTFEKTRDDRVFISRGGRVVKIVGGWKGRRLAAALSSADLGERQHLLARATGNYRRGNERATHE
jgi:hypothetical protein